MASVVLLGPQRFRTTVGTTARSLDVADGFAAVTAGWQEREDDDDELREVLEAPTINLRLYARWLDVLDRDPDFAAADRERQERLDQLRDAYLLQLDHAVEAVYELQRRLVDAPLADTVLVDAIAVLRELDARNLARVAEVHADFYARTQPHDRPVIQHHRDEVARRIADVGALAIAGGHVGELLRCLHLFNVAAGIGDRPVVAWSAGAMAVCETVVLFHDRAIHGSAHAEVHEAGLGLVRGVVPLPHARRRLLIDDALRMAVLARRFEPSRCLVLEDGQRVDCADGVCDLGGASVVSPEGALVAAA